MLPYRYRPSGSEVHVTRKAAPKLVTRLESFSTSHVTFSNSDQESISRNFISNAVFLRTHSCRSKSHVSHVVASHAYDTANLQSFSPHISMTFSCTNIKCGAPYISLAKLLFPSHLHTPYRHGTVRHAIPSPTSQTPSCRSIKLKYHHFRPLSQLPIYSYY